MVFNYILKLMRNEKTAGMEMERQGYLEQQYIIMKFGKNFAV